MEIFALTSHHPHLLPTLDLVEDWRDWSDNDNWELP